MNVYGFIGDFPDPLPDYMVVVYAMVDPRSGYPFHIDTVSDIAVAVATLPPLLRSIVRNIHSTRQQPEIIVLELCPVSRAATAKQHWSEWAQHTFQFVPYKQLA